MYIRNHSYFVETVMFLPRFLKKHQDWVLVVAAAFLMGGVIGFYVWGTNVLLSNLTQAVAPALTASSSTEFMIHDAEKILSDRGLLQ